MKNLPLGIQTFRDIIESNNIYVDKTKDIYKLLEGNDKNFFFLSRPRRFGKSLLISTLDEIFSGNQNLFKGLWIYDKIEWKKYPVIRIDFTAMLYTSGVEGFTSSFFNKIVRIGKKYGLDILSTNYKEAISELIVKLSEEEKVVILIDEYDKPITNFIEDIILSNQYKDILNNFYETIKESEQYIKFAFITGVSKFSKISVFSGLNSLRDITLSENFSTLLGYNQDELDFYFEEHINNLVKIGKITKSELKSKIKTWYNGYSWDGKNFVYNPYSILSLFTENKFNNYWFSSGTPTFLIKSIKEKKTQISQIENIEVSEYIFDAFDIENINVESLLFQTGYLTIKKVEENKRTGLYLYTLGTPNFEVRESLFNYILAGFTEQNVAMIQPNYLKMLDYLESQDINSFMQIIKTMFDKIPYNLYLDKEAYFHSIFYLILSLMNIKMRAEELTSIGRIDGVLEFENIIYIIEFKYGKKSTDLKKLLEKSISQIKEMEYYQKFLDTDKKILLLGVAFADKKIDFIFEEFKL